jgi:hypothetical protein
MLSELKLIKELYSTYNGDRKEWAMANFKDQRFPIASKLITPQNNNDEFILKAISSDISKNNHRLEQSREWLKANLNFELGFKIEES